MAAALSDARKRERERAAGAGGGKKKEDQETLQPLCSAAVISSEFVRSYRFFSDSSSKTDVNTEDKVSRFKS